MLVGDLVSVADAVLDDRPVAADVENRGRGLAQVFRKIKVRRDVQSRQRLEMEFLDYEGVRFDIAGHDRIEIRLLWQRRKAEHFEQLQAIHLEAGSPVIECLDLGQATLTQMRCFRSEVIGQCFIAAGQRSFAGGRRAE